VGPDNATICKGMNVTLNCGFFFINTGFVATPRWMINGSAGLSRSAIDNDPDDLLQWIVDGNDTNTTRLLVGPVDERFVGNTTFQCEIPVDDGPESQIATLTVIG